MKTTQIFILQDANNPDNPNIGCFPAHEDKSVMMDRLHDCIDHHYGGAASILIHPDDIDLDRVKSQGSDEAGILIETTGEDREPIESTLQLEVSYSYVMLPDEEDSTDHNWRISFQDVLWHIHPSAAEYPSEADFELAYKITDQFAIDYKDEEWNCPDCLNYDETIKKYATNWLENGKPPIARKKQQAVFGSLHNLNWSGMRHETVRGFMDVLSHEDAEEITNTPDLEFFLFDPEDSQPFYFHKDGEYYCCHNGQQEEADKDLLTLLKKAFILFNDVDEDKIELGVFANENHSDLKL